MDTSLMGRERGAVGFCVRDVIGHFRGLEKSSACAEIVLQVSEDTSQFAQFSGVDNRRMSSQAMPTGLWSSSGMASKTVQDGLCTREGMETERAAQFSTASRS
jgi:hypothetical protein